MAGTKKKATKISAHATVALLSILTILLCQAPRAPAQDLQASISGTISDTPGAPVPGSSVQTTDLDRSLNLPVSSNQAGRYPRGSDIL
jgi:hypothetical protein